MPEFSLPITDGSWLLWTLGLTVSVLSFQVALEWVRQAQRDTSARQRWTAWLVAGTSLSTGICSAMVMALAGEVQDYAVGYDAWTAGALWLGGALLATLVAVCMTKSQGVALRLLSGAMLGILATAMQAGWMRAAGFLPGLTWHLDLWAGAAPLVLAGFALGSWIALAASRQARRVSRALWAWGAALVLATSLIAGEQVLMAAADLAAQTESTHATEASGSLLAAICGVLVPLAMVFMLVDIAARRGMRRHRRRRKIHRP